jgi:hypothetical protein
LMALLIARLTLVYLALFIIAVNNCEYNE